MLKLGLIPNHTNNIYIKTFHKSSRTVERAMWLRGFPNIMRIFFQINILMYKLRNKSRSGWLYTICGRINIEVRFLFTPPVTGYGVVSYILGLIYGHLIEFCTFT